MTFTTYYKRQDEHRLKSLFFWLWLGSFVSAIGSGMSAFALGVHVFQKTGLASSSGMITLAGFLPGVLLSPLAGVLADRYDRRMLMILGDSLSILGLIYILVSLNAGGKDVSPIYLGLAFSSICTSLLEPAFKATITELLPKEDYAKASGLMQLASSAKFLISPLSAGVLLTIVPVQVILIIDMSTVILTVFNTLIISRHLSPIESRHQKTNMLSDFKVGWNVLYGKKGVFLLVLVSVGLSFFMGIIQVLITPMILSFSNSDFLGFALTFSSSGLLVTSLLLGLFKLKKHFHKWSSLALALSGCFMIGFGWWENSWTICGFGFLFFMMLPISNASFDYLTRTNVQEDKQGRVWGLIGLLSQLGFIIAYLLIGPFVDQFLKPWLDRSALSYQFFSQFLGQGPSLAYRVMVVISGFGLILMALIYSRLSSIKKLEDSHV